MITHLRQTLLTINLLLSRFNFVVANIAKNIAGALLGMMALLILAQVFFRYVLNDSLAWTEELSKFSMVWMACLVAPWAYRENLNVSIQMFAESLPPLLRRITDIIITSLVMFICLMFFLKSITFWKSGLTIYAASMPIKLAYFYSCAPFAFSALFLVAIERIIIQFCSPIGLHQPHSLDGS